VWFAIKGKLEFASKKKLHYMPDFEQWRIALESTAEIAFSDVCKGRFIGQDR